MKILEVTDVDRRALGERDRKLHRKVLDFSDCDLYSIRIDSFLKLTELSELYLGGNNLVYIDPSVFASLVNLTHLSLSNNHLVKLNAKTFSKCPKLVEIWLFGNQLADIENGTFAGLSELAVLSLSCNQLARLDANTFAGCSKLSSLWLYGNKLTFIEPELFYETPELSVLALNNNSIESLDADLFSKCPKLTEISLQSNSIKEIDPRTFSRLENLTKLKLFDNQLSSLDKNTFKNCAKLTGLWLFNRRLEKYHPFTFRGLPMLKDLYIYNGWRNSIDEYQEDVKKPRAVDVESVLKQSAKKFQMTKIKQMLMPIFKHRSNLKSISLLGTGLFGQTYVTQDQNENDKRKVVKQIKNIKDQFDDQQQLIKEELEELLKLKSENVCSFDEYFFETSQDNKILSVCLVSEYFPNATLSNLIQKHRKEKTKFDENLVYSWISQLLKALVYLHSDRENNKPVVVHKNLRPNNIYVTSDQKTIKIADFGLSFLIGNSALSLKEQPGCLPYMAPELLEEKAGFTIKSDVWSLGCVIYEVIKLERLFKQDNELGMIAIKEFNESQLEIDNLILKVILKCMLKPKAPERLDSQQLLIKSKVIIDFIQDS